MQGDDYRHVEEYCESLEKAASLVLTLTPNIASRSIEIRTLEGGPEGEPIAWVKLENLSIWFQGFEKARDLYVARPEREA